MSITFQCLCGKRLKAQESSAGKRTRCPRCGEPVSIPLTAAPAAAPVSRKEAAEAASRPTTLQQPAESETPPVTGSRAETPGLAPRIGTPPRPAAPVPYFMADDGTPAPPLTVRKRRSRQSPHRQPESEPPRQVPAPAVLAPAATAEQHDGSPPPEGIVLRKQPRWHRLISRGEYRGPSFVDGTGEAAVRTAILLSLTAGFTLPFSIGAFVLPHALQNSRLQYDEPLVIIGVSLVLTLMYTCSILHQITVNAVHRRAQAISINPVLAVMTAGGWAAAAFSGPVVPAAGAYLYWLKIGLKEPVDWIIVAELIWLTVFWLTSLLISRTTASDWKSILPHRAARKVWLIPKSIAIHSAAGALVCTGTVFGITQSLVRIHISGFSGIVCMAGTFLTSLVAGSALARSLGRAGHSILPEETAPVDAGIQAFEQELPSSQN